MIVGLEFGWSAVSREPMDWADFQLARQLLAEVQVGRKLRSAVAEEDDAFAASIAAMSRRG